MKVFVSPLQNVMKLIEVMYNEEKGKIYMVSLVWQYDNQISTAMLAKGSNYYNGAWTLSWRSYGVP